ncbi:helix-turn-helix domain-containing protein [Phyllobacterium meliloti]|nr:helix-turn-helix transcriptional regulator [Phyllobacterium sp. T1293]UGX85227.1 helix-turn-helix domain-containing protein [Phyllobacterium sp. T1293]
MELQLLFGANVRHHRKAKGWTLEHLAELVGVSQETIGKIERGKAAPLFDTADKIASALNVPTPVLFGAGTVPGTGERARLLTDIHRTLSRMNDEQLDRAAKMLKAFMG